jgi:hypothetical protein
MLPPELEACELATAQTAPEEALGVSLVRPKASGVSAHADSKAWYLGENMSDITTLTGIL